MRKIAFGIIALLVLASPASFAGEKEALPEGQAMASISISGMTCGGCCTKVESAVAELDGVVKVKADYENKVAMVVYETDKVDVDTIVETINTKTGFKAEAGEAS
jgi:copper chaperone/Cu+-exporting ATPase